ncbi:MAG TPA: Ltp family lipoprotein [Acidimicrobiales bacterium]
MPPTTADPFAGETVSQQNARQKAADYLGFMSFSRKGLIDQLVFEGFTQDDAAYGADAQNADWNEQAAKKAADYLNEMSFSHSGLIGQLVFDGFTQAQAEYGVGTTGL